MSATTGASVQQRTVAKRSPFVGVRPCGRLCAQAHRRSNWPSL